MSEPILSSIKTILEVDLEETIFDDQLLLYLNSGLSYLINNKIPVSTIDATTTSDAFVALGLKSNDVLITLSWLHLYTLQRFDRTLMQSNENTTANWIDIEMDNLLYQLKTFYDNEVQN